MKNLLSIREIVAILVNKLTLAAAATGFTISGGTTSKTLTVTGDATISGTPALLGGSSSQAFATAALTASGLFTTNGQIQFPSTQNASSDANCLDDYEEGTWTPSIYFQGTGSASYTTRYGYYTKIGRVVHVKCYIEWGHTAGTTDNIGVTDLPFSAASDGTPAYGTAACTSSTYTKGLCVGVAAGSTTKIIRGDNGEGNMSQYIPAGTNYWSIAVTYNI